MKLHRYLTRGSLFIGRPDKQIGGKPVEEDSDLKITQLERGLAHEQERLEKLWDAYEQQEKDLNASLDRISKLETEVDTKKTMINSLEELLQDRDNKLRNFEVKIQQQTKISSEYEPKVKDFEDTVKGQADKYERLLSISQDMEDELNFAKAAIRARDEWFNLHVSSLEEIATISKDWRDIQEGNFSEDAADADGRLTKDMFVKQASKIKGLGKVKAEKIYDSGIRNLDDLKEMDVEKLAKVSGFTPKTAKNLLQNLKTN
ncbi:MAG: hypothetical protein BEU04_00430 [Marine Group III euryarchaeote CG-Bathy1]|uniref:Helix-hairpin-helix DNA-binding motif class 1 domain-containing protein n=1 Tax=Marine Group III euryarchaeote CG-Bathy1 TaxID=1889001 RepID=A0A1J5TUX5_9ARCH|nr:MAG: hypothetical protein BEU04_00430 [Marine Group III euryarchaeote CG-Bathy1]